MLCVSEIDLAVEHNRVVFGVLYVGLLGELATATGVLVLEYVAESGHGGALMVRCIYQFNHRVGNLYC